MMQAPVVFVCENNLYATATPLRTITSNPNIAARGEAYGMRSVSVDGNDVLALAAAAEIAVSAARRGEGPTLIEARTYRHQGHHENDPVDGVYRSEEERLNWLEFSPIERLETALLDSDPSFEKELAAARAEVDAEMGAAAAAAIAADHPLPSSALRNVWREPLLPELPGRSLNMTCVKNGPPMDVHTDTLNWRAAVRDGICEEFRRNKNTLYFGEGTGERGGTYQHTAGLWSEFGAERIIDTGISELAFTGCSMGMAATGCRAIADTMTVDFMFEATSTLIEQAAKLRYMSNGATSVPMVMRCPAGNARSNGPHHAGAYYPIWAHCPGLIVVAPAFPADAKGLIKTALRFAEDPVIFMETKTQFDLEVRCIRCLPLSNVGRKNCCLSYLSTTQT